MKDFDKEKIKKFLIEFSNDINNKNFDLVYKKWLFDDIAPVRVLTELFYNSGIDPLRYTSYVPIQYAKDSDKVDSIIIPSNIKAIGLDAFKNSNLRQIVFSNSTKCDSIDHKAFSGVFIKRIAIPESIREIGVEAFQGCTELEEVSFPNTPGIKLLAGTFRGCSKLTTIQYNGTAKEYYQNVLGRNWTIGSSIEYIECTDKTIVL